MVSQNPQNQEIEQAIERLSAKMRHVSDAMELARSPVNKKAANQNKAQSNIKRRLSIGKFFKTLLIVCVFAGLSYVLANLLNLYFERIKPNADLSQTSQPTSAAPSENQTAPSPALTEAGKTEDANLPALPSGLNNTNLLPADTGTVAVTQQADFALKEASYQLVETSLGRALDIFITVENRGAGSGQPKLFEIELINKDNKQLMAWPMAIAGDPVEGKSEKIYKTRLLEPPADFYNIRVSMQK